MLSFLIGLVGAGVGLVGWFVYGSLPLLIAGTVLYVIETIMERKNLNPGAKATDFVIFGIGAIVGFIIKQPFYITGMLAINIYSGFMGVIGLIGLLGGRR